jgi:GPH family glycoside/pentoside/hexuronide:cation symporter
MPERMSTLRRIGYGLGNGGFQITERVVVSIAVYFYLPPPDRGLVPLVPEEVFLGFLTVYGVGMLVARCFDSAADPFVGHASDRSRSPLGRRRSFLIYGIVPMVALPVLLFWPPFEPGSLGNAVWLGTILSLYFVAFTVYVAPYLALIPEIAWTESERVRLGTILAICAMPFAAVFATAWPLGIDLGRNAGLSTADAVRWVVVIAAGLAFVLCLLPILAVDEKRFARSQRSDLPLRQALRATLGNRAFLLYLGAQLLFIFGVTMIQTAPPYLATVLLGRSEGFAAMLGVGTLAGIGVGFVLVGRLVERVGPKRVMIGCLAVFAVAMGLLGFLRAEVPGGPRDVMNLTIAFVAVILVGIPVSGFLVVPHVLISQMIDWDERRTGANRAAMYFGVQGLLTKWMYGFSIWAFTYLLSRFGNSPDEPLGVVLVGPVACVTSLIAIAIYSRYPEQRILAEARRPDEA